MIVTCRVKGGVYRGRMISNPARSERARAVPGGERAPACAPGRRTAVGTTNVLGPNPAIDQSTNRIQTQGYGYDSVGNLTSDPTTNSNAIVYDAENKQISYTRGGTTTQYFYDGDGHRVKKSDTSSGMTVFVYNFEGQLKLEYHTDPVPAPQGGGGTRYLTTDHLGSTRVITDGGGNVRVRYDFLPFGVKVNAGIGGRTALMKYDALDSARQLFTQKERDSESELDYFLARYYSSAHGRFESVDPQNAGASEDDPQSWNGYLYARNNPLLYSDPDGRKYIVCGPNGCGLVTDEEFYRERGNFNPDNRLTFTGNRQGYESGDIVQNGEVLASYQQISIDTRLRQLAYETRQAFRDPSTYKRAIVSSLITLLTSRVIRSQRFSQVDRMSRAAAAADRGGLTKAGRQLAKHGLTARLGNRKFPAPMGTPAQINQMAQSQVDDILTNPGTTVINSYRGRFGNTIEYTAPDGRGLVFKANGEFLFFKE